MSAPRQPSAGQHVATVPVADLRLVIFSILPPQKPGGPAAAKAAACRLHPSGSRCSRCTPVPYPRPSRTLGLRHPAITVRCAPAESATVTVFTVAANAVHTSPRLPAVAATATMRGPAAASQRRICSCRFVMQKLLWFSVHTPGRTAKTKRTARTRPPVYQQKRTAPRAFLKTKTTNACGRGRPWYLCIIAKESRRVKFSASNRHFSIQLVIFYADFFFFAILSRRSAHASPRRRTLHVSPCANPDFYGI